MNDKEAFRVDPTKCNFTKRELIDSTTTYINRKGEITKRKHNHKKTSENQKEI